MNRPSQAAKIAAELCGDKTISEAVRNRIQRSRISMYLELRRVRKGLTRKKIAEKMGVSERKVSIIESSLDDELKLGDVRRYLIALGFPKRCVTVQFRTRGNQPVFIDNLM